MGANHLCHVGTWAQSTEGLSRLLKRFCTGDLHKQRGGATRFLTSKSSEWSKGRLLPGLGTAEVVLKICWRVVLPVLSEIMTPKKYSSGAQGVGNPRAGTTERSCVVPAPSFHCGERRCQRSDGLLAFCCFPLFAWQLALRNILLVTLPAAVQHNRVEEEEICRVWWQSWKIMEGKT